MKLVIKRILSVQMILGLGLVFLVVGAGCGKKPTPISRTPTGSSDQTGSTARADAPAPTVELSATPTSLQRGEETTLTWDSTNANYVVIDGGVGNVSTSGSVTVSPLESTTYTATARGDGGEASSSARVTVVRDERRGQISETDVEGLQRAIEEGLVEDIFFAYDSAEISPQARSTLEENTKWFRRFPNAQIIIEGHCDERGTEEYNLALGDRRAQSTRDYLVQLGIDPNRIDAISYGEERPFVQGTTESAYAQNRRAHFVVR